MFTFAVDYYLFVLAACIGVIQVAASLGGLKGLFIVRSPARARAIGLVVTVAAVVWFLASDDRNVNDFEGGLDANGQALFFFWGSLGAVVATLVASSLRNWRMGKENPAPGEGLDGLKSTSYLRALVVSLKYWRREWRKQTKPYFFG